MARRLLFKRAGSPPAVAPPGVLRPRPFCSLCPRGGARRCPSCGRRCVRRGAPWAARWRRPLGSCRYRRAPRGHGGNSAVAGPAAWRGRGATLAAGGARRGLGPGCGGEAGGVLGLARGRAAGPARSGSRGARRSVSCSGLPKPRGGGRRRRRERAAPVGPRGRRKTFRGEVPPWLEAKRRPLRWSSWQCAEQRYGGAV